jgi:dethiobiotin synthetase
MTTLRGPVVVTGTDTGVGKTMVTAAIAAAATLSGLRVAVVKPCQTGLALGEEPDADVVARLAAPASSKTLFSYPDPLAPSTAARVAGLPMLALGSVLGVVTSLAASHDLVLIEGAGGLLVSLGSADWTIADLAVSLGAPAIVVARPDLGTLNHTALTRQALDERGVEQRLVLGSWPAVPELVHRTNLRDLPSLSGVLPAGAGGLAPEEFRRAAAGWLSEELHGDWQPDSLMTLAL